MDYILEPSPRSAKKWRIITPTGKKVDFGATGYSDFTLHKDFSRKNNYISRHEPRENWTKSGIDTAGFWSRWLLWNLPDLTASAEDIERRFGVKIDMSRVKTNSDGSSLSGSNTNNTPLSPISSIALQPMTTITDIYSNTSLTLPMRSLPPVPRSPSLGNAIVSNNTNNTNNQRWVNVCDKNHPPCNTANNTMQKDPNTTCRPINKLPGSQVKTIDELTPAEIIEICQPRF